VRLLLFAQRQHTMWYAEEGASISINLLQRTAHSAGFFAVPAASACGPSAHQGR
jgi:hypothetical protein